MNSCVGRYLLCVSGLEEVSWEQRSLALLDRETKRRAEAAGNRKRRAEIIGGGLLLQLALWECGTVAGQNFAGIARYNLPELVVILEGSKEIPQSVEFDQGTYGKPGLKNYPWHYNMSHSGAYVFLVMSEDEVGVDLQQIRQSAHERWEVLAKRFFSEEENNFLADCKDREAAEKLFFRLWCRKEARAKLEGIPLANILDHTVMGFAKEEEREVFFEEYESEGYQLAVCRWKRDE